MAPDPKPQKRRRFRSIPNTRRFPFWKRMGRSRSNPDRFGRPFRTWDRERIYNATVEQALNHPTWSSSKITIDSASMANKGLELIEAVRLFDLEPETVSA